MTLTEASNIQPIAIESEMKKSYLDYAMSVIVSRAIPDVRDGLKPVHRRILFGMMELGVDYNKPYKKSARIVGDVMGKYHPHGDSAIYDALVRMAQPFSMSAMLVDGQGNFGSMDGDNAAAMRYTEARMAKISHELLSDIDKDTVAFQENYDGNEKEPTVLPAKFPNILVNGAGGIAVGMATNIPPHNLGEVCDATCMLIDNPEATIDDLMTVCPAPDFPTGGLILGRTGSYNAMHTGRGSVVMRAKTEIETLPSGRDAIIVHEVPYQVNKARLIEKIAELVRDKKVEGIGDLRDESDKSGVRVVIEIKRDAVADVVLNQLFTYTQLQTSFGVNMLALNGGRPQSLNLKDVLEAFIKFREEVITRRTIYLLNKARDRAHVLIGLAIAVANIDDVIAVIRGSKDPVEAKAELMSRDWDAADVTALLALVDDSGNQVEDGRIKFTEAQARAILELRLQRLTGLEREKIDNELSELATEIKDYLDILGNRERLYGIMRDELTAIREEFAVPRRTEISDAEFEADMEDLIQREDMVVTVTEGGYIKRVALDAYRAQRRGGKGRRGMATRDEDVTTEVFVANTHTPVLFFSSGGKVFKQKVYRLPQGDPAARGKALVNIFPLEPGETIETFMPLPEDEETWDKMSLMFATARGNVRRSDLSDFQNVMRNGKIAIRLDDGDALVGVRVCDDSNDVMLAARSGKCVRFNVAGLRVIKSRTSTGVRGMKLGKDDEVVSISVLDAVPATADERIAYVKAAAAKRRAEGEEAEASDETTDVVLSAERIAEMEDAEQFVLTITENGFGKRTSSFEYRATNRGGVGIVNIATSKRNGPVVASFPIEAGDQILLMTNTGKLIRTPVHDVRIAGRSTQGVTLFKVDKNEQVVSAVRINESMLGDEEDDEALEGEAVETAEATEAETSEASEAADSNDAEE
ncbi:MAG: DNA gyrase subunit A [Rickettsiales bacterium]|nr:DNA gyrase subunit A [Rickettsiales bacterium]